MIRLSFLNDAAKPMLRYQVFFGTAAVLIVALLVVNIIANADDKHDAALAAHMQAIMGKVDDYASVHHALPDGLTATSATNTDGIDYRTLNYNSYELCAVFKKASKGPTNSYNDYDSGVLQAAKATEGSNTSFVDGNFDSHTAGRNCAIYTSYSIPERQTTSYNYNTDQTTATNQAQLNKPYLLCHKTRYSYTESNQVVSGIDTTGKTLDLEYNLKSTANTTVPQQVPRTYDVPATAEMYDANCKQITLSDLTVGAHVVTYRNSTQSYILEGLQVVQ